MSDINEMEAFLDEFDDDDNNDDVKGEHIDRRTRRELARVRRNQMLILALLRRILRRIRR